MTNSQNSFRSELVSCLRRLAASAEIQAQYLKDLGVYPSADELALELHELALLLRDRVAAGEVSIAEKAAVEQLDRYFRSFSGSENETLWTVDALAVTDEWKKARALASECLATLAEPA